MCRRADRPNVKWRVFRDPEVLLEDLGSIIWQTRRNRGEISIDVRMDPALVARAASLLGLHIGMHRRELGPNRRELRH